MLQSVIFFIFWYTFEPQIEICVNGGNESYYLHSVNV